jgi:hypothetical protein
MDVAKEIYHINIKVQLVTFKVVPFAIYTLVPTVLTTSKATLEIIFRQRSQTLFRCSFELWNRVKTVSFHRKFNIWE